MPGAVRRFEQSHPDEPVRAARACKATRGGGRRVERGAHWILARRVVLLVTDARVCIGPWELTPEDIVSAEVVHFRQLGMAGAVLILADAEGHEIQAGFTDPAEVLEALPVEVGVREGGVRYSRFSVALRLFLLGLTAWLVWRAIRG